MKQKPQNTYRHLLNFVDTTPSRPILNGIHFTEYGHLEATNSHILLRLINRVPKGTELVLHPKELQEIEGNYPDTDRLFPTDFKATWVLEPEQAAAITKFLKSMDKESLIDVSGSNSELTVTETQTKATQSFELVRMSDDASFSCKARYLGFMMAFIADCIPVPVDIGIVSPIRPVVFEVNGLFAGLVTPVRTK